MTKQMNLIMQWLVSVISGAVEYLWSFCDVNSSDQCTLKRSGQVASGNC